MRSGLVVVGSPRGYRLTGLLQRLKPVLIQAFITKRAVKALNIGVLRRAAGLDQDVLGTVLLRPCHERPASKLRSVVSPESLGVAPKRSRPIQQSGNVEPANAKVGRDVHTLAREVICHRKALNAPGDSARSANGIADEVHTLGLIHCQSRHQRHPHPHTFNLLAFPDGQPFSGVDAVDPLVIDIRVLGAQNIVDHSVAPAPAGVRSLHDLLAQLSFQRTGLTLMTVAVSA